MSLRGIFFIVISCVVVFFDRKMDIKERRLEVLQFCKAHIRAITIEDLEKPTLKCVWSIYFWFVQKLTDCPENSLSQPWSMMTGVFEHREIHDVSAPVISLCLALHNILDQTGFDDGFYVRDLLTPSGAKTVRVLHYLITVYVARARRTHVVDSIMAQAAEAVDKLQMLTSENEHLKERIVAARLRLAQSQPILDQVQKEQLAYSDELRKKKENVQTLNQKAGGIDKEVKDGEGYVEEARRKADRIQKESEELDAQIVTSPERLTKELEKLEEEKAEMATRVREVNAKVATETERKEKLIQIETALKSIIAYVDILFPELEHLNSEKAEYHKLAENLHRLHSDVETTIRSVERHRNTLQNREAQSKNAKQRVEPRVVETRQKMNHVRSELERLARQSRVEQTTITSLVHTIEATRTTIKQVEQDYTSLKENTLQCFKKLKMAMDQVQNSGYEFFDTLVSELKKKAAK